jgi:hypothetical protein
MTTLRFIAGSEPVDVEVRSVLNFGYAARDQDGLRAHVEELAERGVAGPATIPALYSLVPDRVTTDSAIRVVGHETYAEVEYALVLAAPGRWLVTVASDHTDAIVEEADMPRGKGMVPDVLAPDAWWLEDVAERFDQLVLSCEQLDGTPAVAQHGPLSSLLPVEVLLETLERRLGHAPEVGTVVLSGTIDGLPERDGRRWRISLVDPAAGRTIEHVYRVDVLPAELHEPVG